MGVVVITCASMELGRGPLKGDHFAGYLEDDSDLEYSDCSAGSSGDEEKDNQSLEDNGDNTNQLLLIPSRSKSCKESVTEEDEFDQEMDKEADLLLAKLLNRSKSHQNQSPSLSHGRGLEEAPPITTGDVTERNKEKNKKVEYYDEIYFDSTSEDEAPVQGLEIKSKSKTKRKVRKLTNNELFYDPNLDDEDEKWVEKQRRTYRNTREKTKKSISKGASVPSTNDTTCTSDAVLNCPACMSTLSLDCQRHDSYPNQFRAMFVLNCKVIKDELLHYKTKPDKRKRERRDQESSLTPSDASPPSDEVYNPVKCSVCETEVAVLDNEQVFHFFNVLSSPP